MVFEVFGVLLAALIQGIIISIYGSKVDCDVTTLGKRSTMPFLTNSSLIYNIEDDNNVSNSNKLVRIYF